MNCPNCKFEQEEGGAFCEKCGLVFSKWAERNSPSAGIPGKDCPKFVLQPVKTTASTTLWILSAIVIILVIIVSSANRKTENSNLFKKMAEEKGFSGNVVPSDKVALISSGEEVDILKYLEPGKIVVFDFYADWCGPCIVLTPKLEALAEKNKDVVIRKINIQTWQSKVAAQYDIRFVPNIRVYNKKGKMVGEPSSDIGAISKYLKQSSED